MAFTGVAVVKSLGKYRVKISGVSLLAGASGIIGLNGDAGADVQLPATFPNKVDDGAIAAGLDMTDIVSFSFNFTDGVGTAAHLHETEAASPFRLTITNDTINNSSSLDMYVSYQVAAIR